ncbi:MAG: taurine ABC transporter substrate-binding protein, partial [Pseudomonadota bacterium]|nr:taurine ABC transporter substrate-binding protein [Pseudomonadota bacterium]
MYILSKQAGAQSSAVPVYSRRLFSQNNTFDKANARLEEASDLFGKRIAIWAFRGTMSVSAKGDLQGEY